MNFAKIILFNFIATMCVFAQASTANQVDWDSIKHNSRYDITGPKVLFVAKGQAFEARYVDVCIDGNSLKSLIPVCLKEEVISIPGRGSYSNCIERGMVTAVRERITSSWSNCIEREWRKVKDTNIGDQGQYEWVCTKSGMIENEIPTSATLAVSFYKEGRFESNGAPKTPTMHFNANYELPSCEVK
jgi:hypothetical protein